MASAGRDAVAMTRRYDRVRDEAGEPTRIGHSYG